jgi:hypothetical protein
MLNVPFSSNILLGMNENQSEVYQGGNLPGLHWNPKAVWNTSILRSNDINDNMLLNYSSFVGLFLFLLK